LDGANIDAWKKLPEQFHQAHAQRYGHADRSAPLEIVSFGATAIGHIEAPQLPKLAPGKKTPDMAAIAGSRLVFFESVDHQAKGVELKARVYHRELLLSGNEITGPAVIEEVSATTVLYPGDRAVVDPSGSLIVEVAL
jgi:N-methylhydantoinase A